MRPIRYATKELVRAFDARKVLDLAQVKAALGTPVKMTALRQLRQLRQLDYHSSYSHAGRYYTLERIAEVLSNVVDGKRAHPSDFRLPLSFHRR